VTFTRRFTVWCGTLTPAATSNPPSPRAIPSSNSAANAGTIVSVCPPRAASLNDQTLVLARHRHLERRRGVLARADALGSQRQRLAWLKCSNRQNASLVSMPTAAASRPTSCRPRSPEINIHPVPAAQLPGTMWPIVPRPDCKKIPKTP
jgi:hypothetical protein